MRLKNKNVLVTRSTSGIGPTKITALKTATTDITCNAISPGWVRTQLALFFCSPAANDVRGVAWRMDGGWTAQ